MSYLIWTVQILLALHTLTGAIWKLSHSAEQTMPSLAAIPDLAWIGLSVFEVLCALGLALPVFNKRFGFLAPIAAIGIAAEMVVFCALHLFSGPESFAPMIYWLVVAGLCAFVIYGRIVLAPSRKL